MNYSLMNCKNSTLIDNEIAGRTSASTSYIIEATCFLGCQLRTEEDFPKFLLRLRMYQKIFSNLGDWVIPKSVVYDHIGLVTDAETFSTAKFRALIIDKLEENVLRSVLNEH